MTQKPELIAEFPLADLRLFHRNARRGDIEAIKRSVNAHGFYRTVVVNKGTYTGRPNEVLCGNHSVKALRDLGWKSVPVTLVDYDEEQATKVVLIDNKTSDDASYDVPELTSLLQELDDLEGTGYTDEDLDKLLNGLDDGEPVDSEHEEDYQTRWEIVVEADSEEHQQEIYHALQGQGYRLRVLSL